MSRHVIRIRVKVSKIRNKNPEIFFEISEDFQILKDFRLGEIYPL